MEKVAVPVPDVEAPVTLTVNVALPALVGVPEMTPDVRVSVNPDGSEPAASDQV
jgi:hypothetical protein